MEILGYARILKRIDRGERDRRSSPSRSLIKNRIINPHCLGKVNNLIKKISLSPTIVQAKNREDVVDGEEVVDRGPWTAIRKIIKD